MRSKYVQHMDNQERETRKRCDLHVSWMANKGLKEGKMHASKNENDARAARPECMRRPRAGWVEANDLLESWTMTKAECLKQTNIRASGKTPTLWCSTPSNAKVRRCGMNMDSVALVDGRIPTSPRD